MARRKPTPIVTRDSLAKMLSNPNRKYVEAVIGRALLSLLDRQTEDEKRAADTRVWNAVGFSGADARSGTLTAKFYAKHGCLLDWQVNKWTKPASNGYPRLCKYHKQLNEIALEKRK
jgi:hypothetical protein